MSSRPTMMISDQAGVPVDRHLAAVGPPTAGGGGALDPSARRVTRHCRHDGTTPYSLGSGVLAGRRRPSAGPGQAMPGTVGRRGRRRPGAGAASRHPCCGPAGEPQQRPVVLDDHAVGMTLGRDALDVDDLGRRQRRPPASLGTAQPPAQVDVLGVHEVGLVEPADLPRRRPAAPGSKRPTPSRPHGPRRRRRRGPSADRRG